VSLKKNFHKIKMEQERKLAQMIMDNFTGEKHSFKEILSEIQNLRKEIQKELLEEIFTFDNSDMPKHEQVYLNSLRLKIKLSK